MNTRYILNKLSRTLASGALIAANNTIGALIINSNTVTRSPIQRHNPLESAAMAASGAVPVALLVELWLDCKNRNDTDTFLLRVLLESTLALLAGPSLGRFMFTSSEFQTMSYGQIGADTFMGAMAFTALGTSIGVLATLLKCLREGALRCRRGRAVEHLEEPYNELVDVDDNDEGKQLAAPLTLRQRLESCFEDKIPANYLDPVFKELMNDPVMLQCGDNFDRENLAVIEEKCKSCPKCRAPFLRSNFTNPQRNTVLREAIIDFVEEKERLARGVAADTHVINIPQEQKREEENVAFPAEVLALN